MRRLIVCKACNVFAVIFEYAVGTGSVIFNIKELVVNFELRI